MVTDLAYLGLPLVTGIHDWDEWRSLRCRGDRMLGVGMGTVCVAMIVITVASAAVGIWAAVAANDIARSAAEVATSALFVNALGHAGMSALRARLVAGARSALGVVIPFAIGVLSICGHRQGWDRGALVRTVLAGAAALPLIVLAALGTAWLWRTLAGRSKRGSRA